MTPRNPERAPWFRLVLVVALTAAAYYIVEDDARPNLGGYSSQELVDAADR